MRNNPGARAAMLEERRMAMEELRRAAPNLRARDSAERLGMSEAEFVAIRCGEGVSRLHPPFESIIEALPELGSVMVLTRNDHAVHEKVGKFDNVRVRHGLVLTREIDLRLFFRNWRYGFAVAENTGSGVRRSLQFFDEEGTAVHKIYLREESDEAAYERLIGRFAADDQSPLLGVGQPARLAPDRPDGEIDSAGLRGAWDGMKDTHEFVGLLREFDVGRRQALRLAGESYAQEVEPSGVRLLLELASERGVPIMVFVGNRGCIQIHTGPIDRVEVRGPWLNVLDPGFNLHLREDRIASAYVVRKPTEDGDVNSLEIFDGAGRHFAQFFGERKPGAAELASWRALLAALPRRRSVAAE